MKCPHCLVEFHDEGKSIYLGVDETANWGMNTCKCPACKKYIFTLYESHDPVSGPGGVIAYNKQRTFLVYPKMYSRAPLSPHVPAHFADDYKEACITLPDSPKASAALSRRCLQHLLRDVAGVKHSNLANEIQEVLDKKELPSYLSTSLDAIRNIGNFAAHPMKSQSTGEILDVEPGEAEWNLDVLESLFDFYFVQPEILKEKQKALNAKLKKAGKPPMK